MRMIDTVIKPMHPEGYKFVAAFAAVTLILFWIWDPLGWLGLGLTVWCYYFFRDPKRLVPENAGLLVSPADGVVSLIERAVPPADLGLGPEPLVRVSVFMSVFNCHVNRAPIAGRVTAVVYRPGKFFNASLDKASDENERNALAIEMPDGRRIAVVQIAGLVARRIMCWKKPGDSVRTGERFGLIRFGSRLDVYLPEGVQPQVALGQTMIAGESIIALIGQDAPARAARLE
ncbi:MAG: phosphatidylserine decarboxylase family protein [Rhodobacter sp.]|nr:phosphatidylserine decarboxylase family protein [Rhodobacter sp.]MBS3979088.1 phosphatidylserine decarboxylase [Paracoccaceae bacterium]